MCLKTNLLRRLQAQTLPGANPPVGKIHPFSKIAVRGCSQIMSAAKWGGVCKILTMADKGGRGVRQMLTMADKGGGGSGYY